MTEYRWQVFKTVVYVVGWLWACLWLLMYNYAEVTYYFWIGSTDLAYTALVMCVLLVAVQWLGIGLIVFDGLKRIKDAHK